MQISNLHEMSKSIFWGVGGGGRGGGEEKKHFKLSFAAEILTQHGER